MRLWRLGSSQPSCHNQTDQLPVAVRSPGLSAAGQAIVQRIRLSGRQYVLDLADDIDDFPHDITAGAAGSTSQQIRGPQRDLSFGVVLVDESRLRALPLRGSNRSLQEWPPEFRSKINGVATVSRGKFATPCSDPVRVCSLCSYARFGAGPFRSSA